MAKQRQWRLAKSLETLRAQINAAFPARSKVSDGTVGDLAHSRTKSDHNPNAAGVVTAMDITHDPGSGVDCNKLAAALQASRDPRVKYLIWRKQITQKGDVRKWKAYGGKNPHDKHLHISVSSDPNLYDANAPWNLAGLIPKTTVTLPEFKNLKPRHELAAHEIHASPPPVRESSAGEGGGGESTGTVLPAPAPPPAVILTPYGPIKWPPDAPAFTPDDAPEGAAQVPAPVKGSLMNSLLASLRGLLTSRKLWAQIVAAIVAVLIAVLNEQFNLSLDADALTAIIVGLFIGSGTYAVAQGHEDGKRAQANATVAAAQVMAHEPIAPQQLAGLGGFLGNFADPSTLARLLMSFIRGNRKKTKARDMAADVVRECVETFGHDPEFMRRAGLQDL
jgi:hypothetical protein